MAVSRDPMGHTIVTPATDARIIHVSSSNGSDTNNGLSTSSPVKSIAIGLSKLRDGFGDQLLLNKGDIWDESIDGFVLSGKSADEPIVIGSYGSGNRPVLRTGHNAGITIGAAPNVVNNVYIIGLQIYAHTRDPLNLSFNQADTEIDNTGIAWGAPGSNILIEDCYISHYRDNIRFESYGSPQLNVSIRKNVIVDSYGIQRGTNGIYANDVRNLIVEENIIDHNGWNEDIQNAAPSVFGNNVYVDFASRNVTVRDNIIMRAANHGLQLRCGGNVQNNLFVGNSINALVTHSNSEFEPISSLITDNVFLSAKDINDSSPRGGGISVGNITTEVVIKDNVLAHTDRPTGVAISAIDVSSLIVTGNIIYNWIGNVTFNNVTSINFNNNQIQAIDAIRPLIEFIQSTDLSSHNWADNVYYSTRDGNTWFMNGSAVYSFNTWVSATGENGRSNQLTYPDATRSIPGYNQFIGDDGDLDVFADNARAQLNGYEIDDVIVWLRLGYVAGGLRRNDDGFTVVSPALDAKVIHVSSSTGSDANDGLASTSPVKTIAAGVAKLRNTSSDQILLKRGDVFDETFGTWVLSGASADEPMVIGAYGDGPRPIIESGVSHAINIPVNPVSNLIIHGIEFYANGRDPGSNEFMDPLITAVNGINWLAGGSSVAIEDCKFRYYAHGIYVASAELSALTIRRNIITDCYGWNGRFRSAGAYFSKATDLIIEENTFDHNGWNEAVSSLQQVIDYIGDTAESSEIGKRTAFNHNLVIHNDNSNVVVNDNISTRASSRGISLRSSGRLSGNIIARCPEGIVVGGGDLNLNPPGGVSVSVENNIISEGTDISLSELRGDGIRISDISASNINNNIITKYVGSADSGRIGISIHQNAVYDNNIIYNWNSEDSTLIFRNPERSLGGYNALQGGDATTVGFIAAVTGRAGEVWLDNYDTDLIDDYFTAGFESVIPGVSVDENGFTQIVPNSDSLVIYVSSSVGDDDNDGLTEATPVATIAKGVSLLRDGFPDQLLLKSGDIWLETFGVWALSGRSATEPILISSYGGGSRPVIDCDSHGIVLDHSAYISITKIEFYASIRDPGSSSYVEWNESIDGQYRFNGITAGELCHDILIEDCIVRYFAINISLDAGEGELHTIKISRSSILNAWDVTQFNVAFTSCGLMARGVGKLKLIDNLFDHNGWDEDAAFFAGRINTNNNVVVQAIDGSISSDLEVIGNFFTRGSHGGLLTTVGGTIANNVFGLNAVAGDTPTATPGVHKLSGNLIIDAVDSDIPTGRGWRFSTDDDLVINDNLIVNNRGSSRSVEPFALSIISAFNAEIEDNLIYDFEGGIRLGNHDNFGSFININGNIIHNADLGRSIVTHMSSVLTGFSYDGNKYYSSLPAPFSVGGGSKTYPQFAAITDGVNESYGEIEFFDAERNLAAYGEFAEYGDTVDDLITGLRSRPVGVWEARNKALTCIDYIREGFNLEAIGDGSGQDNQAPTATVVAAPLIAKSRTVLEFQVIYNDRVGVRRSTISDTNIIVSGPGEYSESAKLVSVIPGNDSNTIIATYKINPPSLGFWDSSHNGLYKINVIGDQVKDLLNNSIGAQEIGAVSVNIPTLAPSVILVSSPVTDAGSTSYDFDVTYASSSINYQIDVSSIDNSDIIVTGPNGYRNEAKLISTNPDTNSTLVTATYRITPPGGQWSDLSNGTYVVTINNRQIIDTFGTPIAQQVIGSFDVAIRDIIDGEPRAVARPVSVVSAGGTAYRFEVIYSDDEGIDTTTLTNGDVRVSGPNDYLESAKLISVSISNNTTVRAIYETTPPSGRWSANANGAYEIIAQPNQVATVDGRMLSPGRIGGFIVSIAPTAPVASMSSNNIYTERPYHYFSVMYSSDDISSPIDINTVNNAVVQVSGPNGYLNDSEVVSISTSNDASVSVVYRVLGPSSVWNINSNGTYTVVINDGQVANIDGVYLSGKALGSFVANVTNFTDYPLVIPTINNLVTGTKSARFLVTYASDAGINIGSINDGDIRVTGPNEYSRDARLISALTDSANVVTAVYEVTAPNGRSWVSANNGSYAVTIKPSEITDNLGKSVANSKIGEFHVSVPIPIDEQPDLFYCNLSSGQLASLSQIDYYRLELCARVAEVQTVTDHNPHRFVELYKGRVVEQYNYIPDPSTYRDLYYYNSRLNMLFKRVVLDRRPEHGIVRAVWKETTDYQPEYKARKEARPELETPEIINYRQLIRCEDGLRVALSIPESDIQDGRIILYKGIGYEYDDGSTDPSLPFPIGKLLSAGEYSWINSCNSPLCNYYRLRKCSNDQLVELSIRQVDATGDTLIYGGICYYIDPDLSGLPTGRLLSVGCFEFVDDCLDERCTYLQIRLCGEEGSDGNLVNMSMRISDKENVAFRYRGIDYTFDSEVLAEPVGPLVYPDDVIWFDECPKNDAPEVINPLNDQNAIAFVPFSIIIPENTFRDEDVDSPFEEDELTYSLDIDTTLSWLSFDPVTRILSGTPDDTDIGSYEIGITATDIKGESVTASFNLTVGINQIPVANPINNQKFLEDTFLAFPVPSDVFSDDDTLTYAATLLNGDPLPSWLNFNPDTLLFTGLPGNSEVGSYGIKIVATDLANQVGIATFVITIINVNDAPEVVTTDGLPAIPDQVATEGLVYTYTVPDGVFVDPDIEIGATDELTYAATLITGADLPEWLEFNPDTKTFSGIPREADIGFISIVVIATDSHAATASTPFELRVVEANKPPTVLNPIPAQQALEDESFHYVVPFSTFADPNLSDVFTYSAELSNGDPLPSWLTFDPEARSFTGIPTNDDLGSLEIVVTITDQVGESASSTLVLNVINVNDPPYVVNNISNQAATEDAAFSYIIPANTFGDDDPDDVLTYTATLADGSDLPQWLAFNPVTRKLSGIPGNNDVGTISVRITATDTGLATASIDFDIVVLNVNDPPRVIGSIGPKQATEDVMFSYQFAEDLFIDPDPTNDILTYSFSGPDWLSLDSNTRTFSGTPDSGDVGSHTVILTATDPSLTSAVTSFTIYVQPVIDAPVLVNPIGNKVVDQDTLFSFTIPSDTFDNEDDETLIYHAELDGEEPLPPWLSFDRDTRAFSGTPTSDDIGPITIRVFATGETTGQAASTTFTVTVIDVNDAPILVNGLPDRSIYEGASLSYIIPDDTFSDPEGDTLTYSASLKSSTVVVAPDGDEVAFGGGMDYGPGVYTIEYINGAYTDGVAWLTEGFVVSYNNGRDIAAAPGDPGYMPSESEAIDAVRDSSVLTATFEQTIAGPISIYLGNPTAGYDGNTIGSLPPTFKLKKASEPLPMWLSFDTSTKTLSGVPSNDDVGALEIEITAHDGGSLGDGTASTASDTFILSVLNVNSAPFIVNAIPTQIAVAEQTFSYTIPYETFGDADVLDRVQLDYNATLSDGSQLPEWLSFDKNTRTLSGTPSVNDIKNITINIRASDPSLASATATVDISVLSALPFRHITRPTSIRPAFQAAASNRVDLIFLAGDNNLHPSLGGFYNSFFKELNNRYNIYATRLWAMNTTGQAPYDNFDYAVPYPTTTGFNYGSINNAPSQLHRYIGGAPTDRYAYLAPGVVPGDITSGLEPIDNEYLEVLLNTMGWASTHGFSYTINYGTFDAESAGFTMQIRASDSVGPVESTVLSSKRISSHDEDGNLLKRGELILSPDPSRVDISRLFFSSTYGEDVAPIASPFFATFRRVENISVPTGFSLHNITPCQSFTSLRSQASKLQSATDDYLYHFYSEVRRLQGLQKTLIFVIQGSYADLTDSAPSVGPLSAGSNPPASNTMDGYKDNIQAIINRIRSIAAFGDNVYFLLIPGHQVDQPDNELMYDFRSAARQIAFENANTTAVDLSLTMTNEEYANWRSGESLLTSVGYDILTQRILDAINGTYEPEIIAASPDEVPDLHTWLRADSGINEEKFLMHNVIRDDGDYIADSRVFRWNGSKFSELHTIETAGATSSIDYTITNRAIVDLDIYNNPKTGLDFYLEVTNKVGGKIDFTIVNRGGSPNQVNAPHSIIFESGWADYLETPSYSSSNPDNTYGTVSAGTLYDAHKIDNWNGIFLRASADNNNNVPKNRGNTVTVSFTIKSGVSVGDIMAVLGTTGHRIATHTISTNVATISGNVTLIPDHYLAISNSRDSFIPQNFDDINVKFYKWFPDREPVVYSDADLVADIIGTSLTIEDTGNAFAFTFSNNGVGSVVAISFESGLSSLLTTAGDVVDGDGSVSMFRDAGYDLLDGDEINWQGNLRSVTASTSSNGLNHHSESLTITLPKVDPDTTIDDLLPVLNTHGNRIALVLSDYDSSTVGVISGYSADRFVQVQTDTADGANKFISFEIDNVPYLFLCNGRDNITTDVSSFLYKWKWSSEQFFTQWTDTTSQAIDAEHFTVGDDHYLVVANRSRNLSFPDYEINSTVYKWNPSGASGIVGAGPGSFVVHQLLPTNGARDLEYFELGGTRYLIISQEFADPAIYTWNSVTNQFVEYSPLDHLITGPIYKSLYYEAYGTQYLATIKSDATVQIYVINGAGNDISVEESETLSSDIRSIEHTNIGSRHYLIITKYRSAAGGVPNELIVDDYIETYEINTNGTLSLIDQQDAEGAGSCHAFSITRNDFDNHRVSYWQDQADGNNGFYQPDYSKRPLIGNAINDLQTVDFNGNNQLLSRDEAVLSGSDSRTIILIGKVNKIISSAIMLDDGNDLNQPGGILRVGLVDSGVRVSLTSRIIDYTTPPLEGESVIITAVIPGPVQDSDVKYNGSDNLPILQQIGSGDGELNIANNWASIGARHDNDGNLVYTDMSVSEVIVYDRLLSDYEIKVVQLYLSRQYGITLVA